MNSLCRLSVKFKGYLSDVSPVLTQFEGIYLSKETETTLEEKKATILIKLRGYKLLEKKEYKNATGCFVKTPKGK